MKIFKIKKINVIKKKFLLLLIFSSLFSTLYTADKLLTSENIKLKINEYQQNIELLKQKKEKVQTRIPLWGSLVFNGLDFTFLPEIEPGVKFGSPITDVEYETKEIDKNIEWEINSINNLEKKYTMQSKK